jgi:hypothetical protein
MAAQIEAESFSKYDVALEQRVRNNRDKDQVLTDDQLDSLFSEMKAETQDKKNREMTRFKSEVGEQYKAESLGGLEDDDEGLGERGVDDEEIMGIIGAARTDFGNENRRIGLVEAYSPGSMKQDEALEDEPSVSHFDEDFKQKLAHYKIKREQEILQT